MARNRDSLIAILIFFLPFHVNALSMKQSRFAEGKMPSLLAWQKEAMELHKLRISNLSEAKKRARLLLKHPALLARSLAVDILGENLSAEDAPFLRQVLADPANFYRGKSLFIRHQAARLLLRHGYLQDSEIAEIFNNEGGW